MVNTVQQIVKINKLLADFMREQKMRRKKEKWKNKRNKTEGFYKMKAKKMGKQQKTAAKI